VRDHAASARQHEASQGRPRRRQPATLPGRGSAPPAGLRRSHVCLCARAVCSDARAARRADRVHGSGHRPDAPLRQHPRGSARAAGAAPPPAVPAPARALWEFEPLYIACALERCVLQPRRAPAASGRAGAQDARDVSN